MCGVIAFVGKPDHEKIKKMIHESEIRGLHHTGSALDPGEEAAIFHTRYSTSGKTNQPLQKGDRFMAFNGVINMGTKEEMEKEYGIKMETDNDGEVMLTLCKNAQEAVLFLKNSSATFAGVWLEPGKLTALRNAGRPLWCCETPEVTYIASTRDIFYRSGIREGVFELEPLKIYEWTF